MDIENADLNGDNIDSRRVPSRPLPSLYTHGTKAQEAHSTITLTHLYAVPYLMKFQLKS
jgi:hypothetical protein